LLPNHSDSIDVNERFSSREIINALRMLEPILGRATIEALEYDFEVYGLPLVNEHTEYSFAEIEIAIKKIFGDATHLFLVRFTRALNAVSR